MNAECEVELPGELKSHTMRIEFDFQIAESPARVNMARFDDTFCDPGDPGSIDILSASVILMRDGEPVRERKVTKLMIERLRNDDRLADMLYEKALEGLPHE